MKTIVFIAVIILFPFASAAQGIEFEHGSWQDVLAKAVLLNKPVFADVYTTWCGPCKQMSENIFPLEEAGTFFNENFINYKLDAEKGDGVRLAELYEVHGYPTYLFIKPDGQLFYSAVGSMPLKHFLALGQQALIDYKNPEGFLVLKTRYENNRTQVQAVQAYLEKRIEMNLTNVELLEEYLQLLSPGQQDADSSLELLGWDKNSIRAGSTAFRVLIRNRDRMNSLGDRYVRNYNYVIEKQIYSVMYNACRTNDTALVREAIRMDTLYIGKEHSKQEDQYFLEFYEGSGNDQQYFEVASRIAEDQWMRVPVEETRRKDTAFFDQWNTPENLEMANEMDPLDFKIMVRHLQMHYSFDYAMNLNEVAWNYFLKKTDHESLKKALAWSKRSLEFTGNSVGAFLDTYANLLHKLGRTGEAIPWEELAIEKGPDDDEDISSYKITLEKMKKGEPTWDREP